MYVYMYIRIFYYSIRDFHLYGSTISLTASPVLSNPPTSKSGSESCSEKLGPSVALADNLAFFKRNFEDRFQRSGTRIKHPKFGGFLKWR